MRHLTGILIFLLLLPLAADAQNRSGEGDVRELYDQNCAGCHGDTQAAEFDRSVPGSHVIPYESSANPELRLIAVTLGFGRWGRGEREPPGDHRGHAGRRRGRRR